MPAVLQPHFRRGGVGRGLRLAPGSNERGGFSRIPHAVLNHTEGFSGNYYLFGTTEGNADMCPNLMATLLRCTPTFDPIAPVPAPPCAIHAV